MDAFAVGARIRALRQQRGLTQQELAHKLGGRTSARCIGFYETGSRLPSTPIVASLALALGTSIDYLCGLTMNSKSTTR